VIGHPRRANSLFSYVDILTSNSNDLGQTDMLTRHIDTGNAAPIHQPAGRVPLPHDILGKKLISLSNTTWASSNKERWKHGFVLIIVRLIR